MPITFLSDVKHLNTIPHHVQSSDGLFACLRMPFCVQYNSKSCDLIWIAFFGSIGTVWLKLIIISSLSSKGKATGNFGFQLYAHIPFGKISYHTDAKVARGCQSAFQFLHPPTNHRVGNLGVALQLFGICVLMCALVRIIDNVAIESLSSCKPFRKNNDELTVCADSIRVPYWEWSKVSNKLSKSGHEVVSVSRVEVIGRLAWIIEAWTCLQGAEENNGDDIHLTRGVRLDSWLMPVSDTGDIQHRLERGDRNSAVHIIRCYKTSGPVYWHLLNDVRGISWNSLFN